WNVNNMIVLECGHVFTMKRIDEIMEIQKYYNKSYQQWEQINSFTTESENLQTCPNCQYPIKNICRYGRIIKQCLINLQRKRYLPKWTVEFDSINEKFGKPDMNLESIRGEFLRNLRVVITKSRGNQNTTKD